MMRERAREKNALHFYFLLLLHQQTTNSCNYVANMFFDSFVTPAKKYNEKNNIFAPMHRSKESERERECSQQKCDSCLFNCLAFFLVHFTNN